MELIAPGRQFDFMSKRRWFIGASVILLVLSIVSFVWPGLQLGTDFRGGTEVEIALQAEVPVADIRAAAHRAGFEAPEVVSIADASSSNRVLIRVQEVSTLSEEQKRIVRERLCLVTDDASPPPDRCPASALAN